ncbi:MAG TPA: methyltransferase dimerization domain-containing protein, partial [Pyrinomonadaceae bacterium]
MSTAVFETVSSSPETGTNFEPSLSAPQGVPAETVLTQMILGSLASQAVYVAAKLGIADLLVSGPKPVDELAKATETDAPSLYRVLRALASLGIFTEQNNR